MTQLMLKQDAERSFFLAAMMTAATEATLTRRTIWTKRRNQAFFKEYVRSCDEYEWEKKIASARRITAALVLITV